MNDHDPLCWESGPQDYIVGACDCNLIARIRFDERKRIDRAIQMEQSNWDPVGKAALDVASYHALNGGWREEGIESQTRAARAVNKHHITQEETR